MIAPTSRGIDRVLDRLDDVHQVGPNRFKALCPAHEDRSPSLGIALGADRRVLLFCFAGCRCEEILHAIGLTWAALFSDDGHSSRPRRVPPGESEQERACREVLEREARATMRRARWLPYWTAADHVREYAALAAITRARANVLGASHPRVWALLEFAATIEREASNTEVVLDTVAAARRTP